MCVRVCTEMCMCVCLEFVTWARRLLKLTWPKGIYLKGRCSPREQQRGDDLGEATLQGSMLTPRNRICSILTILNSNQAR